MPFLITGLVFASYFVRIPSLKIELGLSDGRLGILLMLPLVSGLLAMQLTGRLVARLGSAPLVRTTMVALPLSLIGFTLVDGEWGLGVALLVFGALDGLIDVSMNAHTIAVERALGRPVMNRCHAAWSIGSALGSLLGGGALKAGLSITQHYLLVAVAMVALGATAGRHLLPSTADRTAAAGAGAGAGTERSGPDAPLAAKGRARAGWRTGWTPRLWLLGATGTIVLLVSGMAGTWSGVYLHDDLGASLATASLGYIGFSVCEGGARLFGDRLSTRLGAPLLVRCAGTVAVAGLTVAAVAPVPAVAVAGFALLGLGLSVLVPAVMSAVGHDAAGSGADHAAAALAKVSTLTYSGLLIGPVVVGWCADAFGLTTTFAGTLVLLAGTLGVGLRAV